MLADRQTDRNGKKWRKVKRKRRKKTGEKRKEKTEKEKVKRRKENREHIHVQAWQYDQNYNCLIPCIEVLSGVE